MSPQQSKRIFGMTYVQIGILAGMGIVALILVGCFGTIVFFRNRSATTSNSPTLPSYTVNEVADNGTTNVAYFLIADKNLSKQDAEKIINYYSDMHINQKGYKLINIWIFCDNTYAYYDVLNDLSVNDDEFYSHVLYWYQTGEISSEGLFFVTEPTVDYPTFGNACR